MARSLTKPLAEISTVLMLIVLHCSASYEIFVYKKNIPLPLNQFFDLVIKTSNFQKEYLQSANREDLSIGEWMQNGGYSTRQMNFTQKVASPPGIPSKIHTVSTQQCKLIADKEIKMTEKFTFTGFVANSFKLDTQWTIEPNHDGVQVQAVTSIQFNKRSAFLPPFVKKKISISVAKDLEKTMLVWSNMVNNFNSEQCQRNFLNYIQRLMTN
mmetsp:Transcript_4361/g.6015  ORF Transcript_4361/g.6015 Transcript_4361/m.6015 type:complete len:212 (+) Transcript_4361:190-825(+)